MSPLADRMDLRRDRHLVLGGQLRGVGASLGVGRIEAGRSPEAEHFRRCVRGSIRVVSGRPGYREIELLGQPHLDFSRHTDPDGSRLFCSTMVSRLPGPTSASTLPASAQSTVQAKVSLAGGRPAWLSTETELVIRSRPRVKVQSRPVPGTPPPSSVAHASSTAIRRSSISSRVKSSRAASPAVAVRSTDRYAPSAGMQTVTWSRASRPLPGGAGTTPAWLVPGAGSPARAVALAACLVADAVVSSVTSALPRRRPSILLMRPPALPATYRQRTAALTRRAARNRRTGAPARPA